MPKIKGPAIFLAQFMRDEVPYNTMENIGKWVASLGYKGVQLPVGTIAFLTSEKPPSPKPIAMSSKGYLTRSDLKRRRWRATSQGRSWLYTLRMKLCLRRSIHPVCAVPKGQRGRQVN